MFDAVCMMVLAAICMVIFLAMASNDTDMALAGMFFFVGLFLFALSISLFYGEGYRSGQIDAANGKVTVVLQRNECGESVWVDKPATQPAN